MLVVEVQPLMDSSPSQDENPAKLTFKISSSAFLHFYASCYNRENLRNESAPQ